MYISCMLVYTEIIIDKEKNSLDSSVWRWNLRNERALNIYDSLLQLKLDESHNLCMLHLTLKGEIFESLLRPKELSHKIAVAASETVERECKLKTPKFDGKFAKFWEQFKVTVHEHNIPDREK